MYRGFDIPSDTGWVLVKGVIRSQATWIVAAIGVAASVMTFLAFGEWGLLWLLIALLLIALIAQHRYIRSHIAARQPTTSETSEYKSAALEAHEVQLSGSDAKAAESYGEEPQRDQDDSSVPDTEDQELNAAFSQAVDAAAARDVIATRVHIDTWIEQAGDEEQRYRRRVFREMLLERAGDDGALERLRQLANDRPGDDWTQARFAQALQSSGALTRAAEELDERSNSVSDPVGRARLLINQADLRRRLGETKRGRQLAESALELGEESTHAKAHQVLGRCLLDEGEVYLAIGHWVKALQEDPSDEDLRFDVAYQASQAGLRDLGILNYMILDRAGAATGVAYNNLGVDLKVRQVPMRSIDYIRRAANDGNALAVGNIANELVNAGFGDEASEWVERGNQLAEDSPRIGQAAQRIAQQRSDDEERLGELESIGWEIERFFIEWVGSGGQEVPTGTWSCSDGYEYQFWPDGDTGSVGTAAQTNTEYTISAGDKHLSVRRRNRSFGPEEVGIALVTNERIRTLFPNHKSGGPHKVEFWKTE